MWLGVRRGFGIGRLHGLAFVGISVEAMATGHGKGRDGLSSLGVRCFIGWVLAFYVRLTKPGTGFLYDTGRVPARYASYVQRKQTTI